MARKKLGEMLVEAGVLSEQGLRIALNEHKRWGGTLGRTLVEMKLLSEAELVRVLSLQLNLPTIDLDTIQIPSAVLDQISGELAEQHNIVPFAQQMKFLDVAMSDPTNLGIIDELRIRTQLNIRPYLAGPKMIERAIAKHYRRGFGRVLRRDAEVPLETGDVISLAPAGPRHARPDTAEIEAARRREGLRPAPPRPARTAALDAPPTTPLGPPIAVPLGDDYDVPFTPPPTDISSLVPPPRGNRDAEIDVLQERISTLEALVARDEDVLRKLLALLVEKGVATREEILDAIR
jgi:type IV pilus assembly protein PilB